MCAKVTGPLYSVTASGKIANAMVHFPWKGIQCVRKWVKPANPQSAGQGDIRQILGGLGRACRPVINASDFHVDAVAVAPAGSTWVGEFVRFARENWMKGKATYETSMAEFSSHTNSAMFTKAAADMNLADLDISYAGTEEEFVKGAMVYFLAKYAIAKKRTGGAFDRAPYTTDLEDWAGTEIDAFCLDFGQTVDSDPTP